MSFFCVQIFSKYSQKYQVSITANSNLQVAVFHISASLLPQSYLSIRWQILSFLKNKNVCVFFLHVHFGRGFRKNIAKFPVHISRIAPQNHWKTKHDLFLEGLKIMPAGVLWWFVIFVFKLRLESGIMIMSNCTCKTKIYKYFKKNPWPRLWTCSQGTGCINVKLLICVNLMHISIILFDRF